VRQKLGVVAVCARVVAGPTRHPHHAACSCGVAATVLPRPKQRGPRACAAAAAIGLPRAHTPPGRPRCWQPDGHTVCGATAAAAAAMPTTSGRRRPRHRALDCRCRKPASAPSAWGSWWGCTGAEATRRSAEAAKRRHNTADTESSGTPHAGHAAHAGHARRSRSSTRPRGAKKTAKKRVSSRVAPGRTRFQKFGFATRKAFVPIKYRNCNFFSVC